MLPWLGAEELGLETCGARQMETWQRHKNSLFLQRRGDQIFQKRARSSKILLKQFPEDCWLWPLRLGMVQIQAGFWCEKTCISISPGFPLNTEAEVIPWSSNTATGTVYCIDRVRSWSRNAYKLLKSEPNTMLRKGYNLHFPHERVLVLILRREKFICWFCITPARTSVVG
jgi:hypothetical protein